MLELAIAVAMQALLDAVASELLNAAMWVFRGVFPACQFSASTESCGPSSLARSASIFVGINV